MKRLPPRTLGLYLGCECEYEYHYYRDAKDNGWKKDSFEVDHEILADIKRPNDYRNHVLILRPLESMTEEERRDINRIIADPHLNFGVEDIIEIVTNRLENVPISFVQVRELIDYLRSKGFDIGGWIEEKTDGVPISQPPVTKWVPSLIKAGLAKEKGKEQ